MNRGFLYGDGFFESIRIINGQMPLLDFHIDRIEDALAIYEMSPSFEIAEDFVREIAKAYETDGVLRINFYRDGGGKYLPEQDGVVFDYSFSPFLSNFFLPTSMDLDAELKRAPAQMGTFAIYPEPKPDVAWMTVKSLSSIYYVLAAKYKQAQNTDYLFIQNREGFICEELISNIILHKGEDYFVPSLKSGGVNGATLRYLMKNYGFAITEKQITMEDVETADAVYSCKGSTGVSRVR